VCLSVCVCVCHIFCQLAYRSDPSTDFLQLIAWRTRIYARIAFWGSRWWIVTFRGPKAPKNHFGGLNKHFKPNMRKIQIAISSDLCIRLTWNLTGSCGQQQRLRGWSPMAVKQFQDGGRPPLWKSIYRHISVKSHRIFMKFCTQQQVLKVDERHVIKNEKNALDRLRVRQNVFLV